MSRWSKVLGWGVLASVLLHWALLDLLRDSGFSLGRLSSPPLQVQFADAPVKAAPASSAAPVVVSADARTAPSRTSVQNDARVSAASPPSDPGDSDRLLPGVQASGVPAGLRSGTHEEALLALRLQWAEQFRQGGWPARLAQVQQGSEAWLLIFDGAGHLQEVEGAGSAALQAALTSTAEHIRLPEALRGRAFQLDLRIEN